ncbi:MAG: hypothetical protein KJ718_02200 [Nanoarchaeota archaeon]|nr:hypothetical protein [Nanoarchaeota archaeon]MBU1051346.1 hypothetical protein [Nanoarchaeota archaeon]MBU1987946.1 hypothetical protein [Nanoarchaeota archaeon]
MEEDYRQCHNCYNEIEEMICERCRLRQVTSWLQDNNGPWSIQALFFRKLEKKLPRPPYEGYCLICGNELPALCGPCFYQEASFALKEIIENKTWLDSFAKMFKPKHVQLV